ncbi:MAG: O-antigen ligase family protein [Flavobacteriaceae bacterium]
MRTIIQKTPREFIYVLLLFTVLFFNTIGYKLGSISIIVLTLFYILDRNLINKIKRLNQKIGFLFLGYFVFHLVGLLYTENTSLAEHEITVRLPFLILPVILFTETISKKYLYDLFVAFKYWLFLLAAILFYHKLLVVDGPLISLPALSLLKLTGIHHAYFSLFYSFALFFVMHQVVQKKTSDFFGFLQITFLLFFITILGARVTMGVSILVSIVFFIQRTFKSKGLLKLFIPLVLIIATFFIFKKSNLVEKFSRLSKVEWNIEKNIYNHQVFTFEYDKVTSNTLELRLIKWYCAYQIIKEHIVFGVGTGDYKDELNKQYREVEFKKGMVYGYNTHSQYIEEFIKFGIIGGVYFVFFIGYVLYSAYRKKNILLFLMSLTFALFLVIESVLVRQHGVVFFCFFIPILYIYHQHFEQLKKE